MLATQNTCILCSIVSKKVHQHIFKHYDMVRNQYTEYVISRNMSSRRVVYICPRIHIEFKNVRQPFEYRVTVVKKLFSSTLRSPLACLIDTLMVFYSYILSNLCHWITANILKHSNYFYVDAYVKQFYIACYTAKVKRVLRSGV